MQYINGQTALVFIFRHADPVKTKTIVTHIHGGGLAGSIVTKQWGDMALVEGNIKVFNSRPVAIDLAETVEGNSHWELWEVLPSLRRKSALAWEKHKESGNL